nr:hypothetical protein GCM10020093_031550 [Planobispora longispora]
MLGLSCLFPLMLLSGPFQPDASLGLGLGTAVAGAALLPIAAYPMAAWAGTRAMLTRAILAPATPSWSRSSAPGPAWWTPSSWSGAGSSGTCTTARSSGWSRSR